MDKLDEETDLERLVWDVSYITKESASSLVDQVVVAEFWVMLVTCMFEMIGGVVSGTGGGAAVVKAAILEMDETFPTSSVVLIAA